MNEARAAGTLGHPNIVESTDMGFMESRIPYIVFEYLEGSVLTDEIYRLGGLPVRRAVTIARQIASALHAAHAANIVHRDLKSENVFLTDRDEELDHVKVLDFGISKFLETGDVKTRRGMIMGTPEFMAPEQISNPDDVDQRSDIYALGVILYEMLTGRRPFTNDDPRTLLHRIIHNDPPPMDRDEIPRGLQDMVFKLLEKNPADRFQTMADVEQALVLYATQNELRMRRTARLLDAPITTPVGTRRMEVIAARETPWPARPGTEPFPLIEDDAAHVVSLPAVARAKVPWVMYALVGLGLIVGGVGLYIGLRAPVSNAPPVAATPPPAAPAAATPIQPEPAKVSVSIEATTPDARVTFRRRIAAAPLTIEVAPTDIVELVEVSAPGHKTVRYWITIDRPTKLRATLVKGKGMSEASEEATLIALGEATIATPPQPEETKPAASRPDPETKPTVTASVAPAKPAKAARKIGKAAASDDDADDGSADGGSGEGERDIFASRGPDITPAKPSKDLAASKGETKPAPVETAAKVEPAPTQPKVDVPAPKPKVDDMAIVKSHIKGRRGDIIKCYEPARKTNPRLQGDLTATVTVDATGAVSRPQIQSTLNSPMVAACVAKSMKSWKFAARPGGQTVTASYKFELY
jgi:serine/threonine-protein kinase